MLIRRKNILMEGLEEALKSLMLYPCCGNLAHTRQTTLLLPRNTLTEGRKEALKPQMENNHQRFFLRMGKNALRKFEVYSVVRSTAVVALGNITKICKKFKKSLDKKKGLWYTN